MKWIVRVLIGLVVVVVIAGGLVWWASRPADPGDFYATPDDLPSEHGVVLDTEDFATRGVPDGASPPH